MHSRRKFLTQSSLTLGALTFLKPLQGLAGAAGGNTEIALLITNGMAGCWQQAGEHAGLKGIREAVTNLRRQQQHVLLVDTGNLLANDSPVTPDHLQLYRALNETGYDAIVPGKTDVQHGADYLDKLVERSGVAAVATNYTGTDNLLSHRIVRRGTVRIGLLGIGCSNAASITGNEALLQALNKKALALKEQHRCGLVVCLSHLPLKSKGGETDNYRLAQHTRAIDVVVSANNDRYTHHAHVVKNAEGNDVLVAHAGYEDSMLGRLDITLNAQGEKVAISSRQIYTGAAGSNPTAAFKKRMEAQFA